MMKWGSGVGGVNSYTLFPEKSENRKAVFGFAWYMYHNMRNMIDIVRILDLNPPML